MRGAREDTRGEDPVGAQMEMFLLGTESWSVENTMKQAICNESY